MTKPWSSLRPGLVEEARRGNDFASIALQLLNSCEEEEERADRLALELATTRVRLLSVKQQLADMVKAIEALNIVKPGGSYG